MILAYVRVSTTEQAADGTTSLAEQTRRCKAIAELRSAGPYDFVTYVDAGVSGSIPLGDRPQGERLLKDAKRGDVICASKMDRLFRSASDALNTAERLKRDGVDLILIDMGTDPVTANGTAKMFFGMLALVAEFERERIKERMDDGRRGKRDRSGHLGGLPPFGFSIVGRGRESKLVPNAEEQKTVALIRKLRKVAPTPHAIKQLLNEKGVPTRTDKPWDKNQVRRILERAN